MNKTAQLSYLNWSVVDSGVDAMEDDGIRGLQTIDRHFNKTVSGEISLFNKRKQAKVVRNGLKIPG